MLGERHSNPHTVLGAIVKALTMAETTYREWKRSVPKKEQKKYKDLNERRESHKKKYNQLTRIEYLIGMGHILDKIHQIVEDGDRKKNQSNETETGEETNEEPMATHNDVTNHENPLEATVTEDEDEEDPYRERIVGKTKRVQERENQKPLYHKKKCAYCGKGFNSKSTFKMCHLCDKIQHKSCIETHVLDNARFACSKCKPTEDGHNNTTSTIDAAVQNNGLGTTENNELVEELTNEESSISEDLDDTDMDMPSHIVKRRNEALRRGKEKRRLRMEQEDEEENNLDKSDHNVNPDTSGGDEVIEPEDTIDLENVSQQLQNQKATDEVILPLLCKLGNIKVTFQQLKYSKIGMAVRHLRGQPGTIGLLATTITTKWKSILSEEFDKRRRDGVDDTFEESNELEEEVENHVEQEDEEEVTDEPEEISNNSILITPPPKYNKEKPVNRPFPCQKCRETFINKQFLKAHTRSKHESEHSVVEDTFECEQCDFSSTYKANLQRHQEKLHKKRKAVTQGPPNSKKKLIFKCDDCDYKSAYKFNVKKHMTRIH